MPQLDPKPWFMIMLCTWAVLLVVIPPKLLTHVYPNDPAKKAAKTPHSQSLTLPWS